MHAADSRTPSSLSVPLLGGLEIEHGKARTEHASFWLIHFGFNR